ncbi:MAG: amidohydrolase family protein, partial [Candidatus Dormibacteria bacterium]
MAGVIIDAHVHLLPDTVRANLEATAARDPWFAACHAGNARVSTPRSLLEEMDAAEIDRAVCFTWPFADPELCAEANDWLAAVVARYPDRLVGFGVVNPAAPGAAAEVWRCARLGLRGLGELNADAQGWALDGGHDAAAVDAVVAASLDAGLVWTLHCSEPVGHAYPGKGTATPGLVAGFAERHPDLRLICAHLGGGLPLYAQMPEVRRLCRRLWFDTAAQP